MAGSFTQRGIGFFFGAPKYAQAAVFTCDLCSVPFSTQKALNAHVVAKHRDGIHLSDAELAAVRENVAVRFALAPARPTEEHEIVSDIRLAEVPDESELRGAAHGESVVALDAINERPYKKKRRKGPRNASSTRSRKSGSLSRLLMHWSKLSTRDALLRPLRVAPSLLLTFDAL